MKRKPLPENLKGLLIARYLRCSNDEQADGEYSTIAAQDEITLRFVLERGGIDAGRYADEGYSGTTESRPGLNRLYVDADNRKFVGVVGTYMSRFGRGPTFTVVEYELSKRGVRVGLAEEKFTDDLAGYAHKTVTQFMDGMYPRMVASWTTTKMREMFGKGYWLGGHIPLGYTPVPVFEDAENSPQRLIPTDERALVVAAYEMRTAAYALFEVREYLSKMMGEVWTNHRTRNLLTNRFYIGEYRWGGMVSTTHEGIIPPELFAMVQEIQDTTRGKRERQTPTPSAAEPHAYYLRNLLFCTCGAPMGTTWGTSRHGDIVRYYQCPIKGCSEGGRRLSVNTQHLHGSLIAELSRMAQHPWRAEEQIRWAVERMPPPENYDAPITALERRLRDASRAVDKWADVLPDASGKARQALLRRIDEEEERREGMEEELSRLKKARLEAKWRPTKKELLKTLSLLGQVWERRTEEQRVQLVSTMVDRAQMLSPRQCEIFLRVGTWAEPLVFERQGSERGQKGGGDRTRTRTQFNP